MFRVMFRLALAGSLCAALPSCGGGDAMVKSARPDAKKQEARQLVSDARGLAAQGKTDSADRSYGEAYALASDAPKLAFEILQEWVDFLGHANRTGRARDVAKQFYDANPADPKGYHLYAEALLLGGRGPEALDVTSQLIQLTPDDAAAHDKRGRALLLVEKDDEGIEELRKAVQLDPTNAKLHMSLGSALHQMNDVNKAALEFRAALKNAPEDPQAHVLLGAALRDQGELDESRTYLDKAIELDPKNGRAYFELGVLFNRQLNQADAEAAFGKAVKYSPNESRFWYAYGEIYRVQDRTDEAISAYRRAVELDPPFPKAIGKLGSVLVETKQYEDAERFLTQAIRREPKNAGNYWWLGKAYAAQRKNRQAIDSYEQFLKYAAKDDANRDRARDQINQLKRR